MRRWHIPAVFLLLITALLVATRIGQGEVVKEAEAGIATGRPHSATPVELQGDTKYNLEVGPQAMCKGCSSQVRIELYRDTEQILELDTTFAADPQGAMNIVTMDFTVPADGLYQPRFSLVSTGGGGERLAWKVAKKPTVPLESWPLAIGLLLLLTVTTWTWVGSDAEALEELGKLGTGTRLKVFGEPGTIEMVTEFREQGYAPGIEYELRMDDGQKLFVAIDRFEEEGYENDVVYHVLMVSEPLDPMTLDGLRRQGADVLVQAVDQTWRLNDNNSGPVNSVIYKVGSVFQSSQLVKVYSIHESSFPKHPGDYWLEHIDYRDGDTEWALMRIISPGKIEVLEATEHQSVPDAQLQQLARMSREARTARDQRDARASNQQQPQQQQQWAQQPFGDGHG